MSILHISPIYILLNIILILVLAYRVVVLRRRFKVGLGDGDKKELRMAIAVHANATENMPLALMVMLVAELNGADNWIMHVSGSILTLARIWHALGTSRYAGASSGRYYGALITWLFAAGMGLYAVYLSQL
ncbi:MAG: MAPEG family protein [Gammaproteobacteria bacterium]|nr:MAPEG family protein [Gammaproteobacteria bacterium]